MHDDVTVVITCFNYGRFVGEAVESARSQARVLVVDDGSTDPHTRAVLDSLPAEVLRQENAGVAAARNAGMARAETPYLLCLDADDRLAPGAIDALRAAASERRFAYGWMQFFGDWSGTWKLPPYDPYRLLFRHQIGLSALIPRELFEATGGFDGEFGEFEDWELWVNALEHGFRGELVPRVVLEYRRHSAAKQFSDRRRYRAMYRRLREKHAPLYARAGELAAETGASRLTRTVYPAFWGRRPLPARVEKAIQAATFR